MLISCDLDISLAVDFFFRFFFSPFNIDDREDFFSRIAQFVRGELSIRKNLHFFELF